MEKEPLYKTANIKDIRDMLNQSVKKYGKKTAFLVKKDGSEEYSPITYTEYKKDVDAFGTALMSLGLSGKRIALVGENRYEWAVTYMSVINGLGVIVPIDKELPAHELESLLERSEANAIIYSGKANETIKKLPIITQKRVKYFIGMDVEEDSNNILSFDNLIKRGSELLKKGDKSYLNTKIDSDEVRIMLFTSGTTAASKAVLLSQKNLCSEIMGMSRMIYFDHNDIFLSFLPLHHTYECTCGFLTPLYQGASVAYCEGLRHIVKNLAESKATIMLGVPLLLESMYKRIWYQASKKWGKVMMMNMALNVSNCLRCFGINLTKVFFKELHEMLGGKVRLFISGAAGVDPKVIKGFQDFGLMCFQGYGLTECSPIVTVNRDICYKNDSAGLPLPGIEVKISNPNNEGIGEIVTKGPNVMIGYYENEEATKESVKNGWFYTGDLGYLDKDGFLYITGRKKNVIVSKNGKNIFPEELEMLLNRSPYIKESMVYEKPDLDGDTIICASIVINREAIEEKATNMITDEQIRLLIDQEIKLVNKQVTLYKHIHDFNIREDEFIKTTTKKIKRHLELVK